MKYWVRIALLLAIFTGVAQVAAAVKPNIILIMADDMGYGDLGCYGHPEIRTPRLDALAAGGIRCTDYHSNGAVCSPTRAALMTGRYQQRCGIEGVITAANHRDVGLPLEIVTMPEYLHAAGYRTGMFGKWHLGYAPEFNPTAQGFDVFHGFVSGNIDLFNHIDQEGYFDWWIGKELKDEPGYATTVLTDLALQFIADTKDQPFFLYMPYPAPHYPHQGPNDKGFRQVGRGKQPRQPIDDAKRAYREMIEAMDSQIGRIVDAVKARGQEDNTLIVYTSDNGAPANGGNYGASNGPLKAGKGSLYEGGHRVPGIFYWPGKIAPRVVDATVLAMDLLPTFAALAGADVSSAKLDGSDISPLLTQGAPLAKRPLFWGKGNQVAMRDGQWKYIDNALYDLAADPGEARNVAGQHPEVADKMAKAAAAWLLEVREGAPNVSR